MKVSVYLVLSQGGDIRLVKNPPMLNSMEVAVKLNLSISDKFFKRFIPETELVIPDEYVLEPRIEAHIKDLPEEKLEELQKLVSVELEKHKGPKQSGEGKI